MFDYSMQDNAIRIIKEGAEKVLKPKEFVSREIQRFKASPERGWMIAGNDYYAGRQAILHKQRTAIGADGELTVIDNLPNNKNVDNQYKKMVKQKVNYLAGKPFTVNCEDEAYADYLAQIFNRRFFATFKNIVKDSLNCGIGWLYVYYNEDGEFSFKRFRPWECIPGWSDADHTKLEYLIRFYNVDCYNGNRYEKQTKVEYYTLEGVDYFTYYNGVLKPSEPWHTDYFSVNGATYNWSKLPFVAFKYNDEEIPLIANCKSLQDGLNTILSNFSDNMTEDARNTILVLVNYDGENLGEFRRNLATYGAVKVRSQDGVTGDLKTLQVEVNADNYKAIISIFKKAIVENCMGYDSKDERMSGTPNQMNIRSMYNDIDLDASDMETEYQGSLEDLLWFINMHLINCGAGNYTDETPEIVFNTDLPMDEGETLDNIQKSVGIISEHTLLSKHPWVNDVQAEIDTIEEEKQGKIEQYSNAFGVSMADQEESEEENTEAEE